MKEKWLEHPESIGQTAGLMRLLSDPTRLRVLGLLQPGEMNVTALCNVLGLAQPTVSHHLGLLRTARLVRTRRDGKQVFYSLNPEHLATPNGLQGLHLSYGQVEVRLGCNGQVR
jgi:DNA-binding transcriptional ArsR family regulator